jgi:hypothetical protein
VDDAQLRRRYGQVFDAVAEEYDRARPTYPRRRRVRRCFRSGVLRHRVSLGRPRDRLGEGGRTASSERDARSDPVLRCVGRAHGRRSGGASHGAAESCAGHRGRLPRPREANTILAGAQERRDNISEVWSWIGRHELAVPEGARLFDDVRITTVPVSTEQTADQRNAQLRTTSLYARIAPDRREQLEAENERIAERFGGAIRWSELAVLATARRASAAARSVILPYRTRESDDRHGPPFRERCRPTAL